MNEEREIFFPAAFEREKSGATSPTPTIFRTDLPVFENAATHVSVMKNRIANNCIVPTVYLDGKKILGLSKMNHRKIKENQGLISAL